MNVEIRFVYIRIFNPKFWATNISGDRIFYEYNGVWIFFDQRENEWDDTIARTTNLMCDCLTRII